MMITTRYGGVPVQRVDFGDLPAIYQTASGGREGEALQRQCPLPTPTLTCDQTVEQCRYTIPPILRVVAERA
jgi:hypothetical protein